MSNPLENRSMNLKKVVQHQTATKPKPLEQRRFDFHPDGENNFDDLIPEIDDNDDDLLATGLDDNLLDDVMPVASASHAAPMGTIGSGLLGAV